MPHVVRQSAAPWFSAVLGVACACVLGGCSPSPESGAGKPAVASQPATKPAVKPRSIVDDAPTDFAALLNWADGKLQKAPDPVPLPNNAKLPEAKWPVIRLDDRLGSAVIRGDWTPATTQPAALAAVGPCRSDRPAPNVGLQKQLLPDEGESLRMTLRGFRVDREQVGSIEIDARFPYGTYFDLTWSRGGTLRIPIDRAEDAVSISIATDGFNEWAGPLDAISINTDGFDEKQPVEIRSLRFIARSNSYPLAAGLRRPRVAREIRSAIYAQAGTEIRFENVEVPPGARLALGLSAAAAAGVPAVRAEVLAEIDGISTPLLAQTVDSGEQWIDLSASLDAIAGRRATIVLRCASAQAGDVALWSNPLIYVPVADAPIVVVYLVDTLAATHLDLYGYSRATGPNLRALAEQGVWFENMYANAPETVMSVPNLLLGLSTERHKLYHASALAPNELVSIADALRAAGFATGSCVTNVNAGPRQNMDQGFDWFIDRMSFHWEAGNDRTVDLDATRRFLEAHADRPTFLYVHTAEPHAPYEPPAEFAGRFATGYSGPIRGTYDRRTGVFAARSPAEIAHVVSLYDEEVAYADHRFGLFWRMLADAKLRDRTTLLLTADHGEEFFQHGNWMHSKTLFNEVLRVPLIVVGPRITQRGKIASPASLVDVMPTLLDMFDLPEPYLLNGRSLMPALSAGATKLSERPVFASSYMSIRMGFLHWAMIDPAGRWKLMYGPPRESATAGAKPSRFALYDLSADPRETKSVLHEHADVARRMILALVQHRARQRPYDAGADKTINFDADQLRELKSMGYVGD